MVYNLNLSRIWYWMVLSPEQEVKTACLVVLKKSVMCLSKWCIFFLFFLGNRFSWVHLTLQLHCTCVSDEILDFLRTTLILHFAILTTYSGDPVAHKILYLSNCCTPENLCINSYHVLMIVFVIVCPKIIRSLWQPSAFSVYCFQMMTFSF